MEQKRVQIEYIPIGEIKPYEKNPRINEGGGGEGSGEH